jgi:hypothetical protein|tara:strand:- start:23 stop:238 length:216 start_codon:yes stop_codon:yes gene_type:complete
MKNFKNFYDKVDGMANAKLSAPKKDTSRGLLSKAMDKPSKEDKTSSDVFAKVSNYIAAIRKQKQELMNGRS